MVTKIGIRGARILAARKDLGGAQGFKWRGSCVWEEGGGLRCSLSVCLSVR